MTISYFPMAGNYKKLLKFYSNIAFLMRIMILLKFPIPIAKTGEWEHSHARKVVKETIYDSKVAFLNSWVIQERQH